jgi:hypothetical protein
MNILSWRSAVVGVCLGVGASAAHAQAATSPIGTGAWIVSGSAGWTHNDPDVQTAGTTMFLSPSALYFFRPRWAIGGSVDLGYSHSGIYKTKSLGVGPEVRFYPADLTDKTLPYLRASVRPSWLQAEVGSGRSSTRDLQSDFAVGLTRLLATHVGLSGELFYTHLASHFGDSGGAGGPPNPDITTDSYGLRFGITAFVF